MKTQTEFDITGWIPVNEFPWPEPGAMFTLTCKNHPSARYLTKNPFMRSLHLIEVPVDLKPEEKTSTGECACAFADMIVDPDTEK